MHHYFLTLIIPGATNKYCKCSGMMNISSICFGSMENTFHVVQQNVRKFLLVYYLILCLLFDTKASRIREFAEKSLRDMRHIRDKGAFLKKMDSLSKE